MKNIHPKLHKINFICNCGNIIKLQSILELDSKIEICNLCHPYNSGKQKIVKIKGRIEKFNKKFFNYN